MTKQYCDGSKTSQSWETLTPSIGIGSTTTLTSPCESKEYLMRSVLPWPISDLRILISDGSEKTTALLSEELNSECTDILDLMAHAETRKLIAKLADALIRVIHTRPELLMVSTQPEYSLHLTWGITVDPVAGRSPISLPTLTVKGVLSHRKEANGER